MAVCVRIEMMLLLVLWLLTISLSLSLSLSVFLATSTVCASIFCFHEYFGNSTIEGYAVVVAAVAVVDKNRIRIQFWGKQ